MYISFTGSNVEDNHRKQLHINGIYTFLIKLRNILIYFNEHPDYEIEDIICFWDGIESGKLRSDIYSNYKISRKNQRLNFTPEEQADYDNFIDQIERVKTYLPHLYIKSYTDPIVETDDMIAYCVHNNDVDNHIVIVTADQDLFQLINENTSVYNLRKKKKLNDPYAKHHLLTSNNFIDFFGYNHKNIPVYKAISGDVSDDIEGVGGVQLQGILKTFSNLVEKECKIGDVLIESEKISQERKEKNLKPLKKIQNIIENVNIINRNFKLVDLSIQSLFITEECKSNIDKMLETDITEFNSKKFKKILESEGIINEINLDMNYLSLNNFFMPFAKYIDYKKNKFKKT